MLDWVDIYYLLHKYCKYLHSPVFSRWVKCDVVINNISYFCMFNYRLKFLHFWYLISRYLDVCYQWSLLTCFLSLPAPTDRPVQVQFTSDKIFNFRLEFVKLWNLETYFSSQPQSVVATGQFLPISPVINLTQNSGLFLYLMCLEINLNEAAVSGVFF